MGGEDGGRGGMSFHSKCFAHPKKVTLSLCKQNENGSNHI